ncbi:MAG: L,D-transpeptidase [Gaiellaceae bacterium]
MRLAAIVAVAVAAAAGVFLAIDQGSSGKVTTKPAARAPARVGLHVDAVPQPIRPAFTPGKPRALSERLPPARWAPVPASVDARTAPAERAPVVSPVDATTPEGTSNILLVLGTKEDAAGRLWAHVRLPVLPNGTTGWVPRDALGGYGIVETHLVVDLEHLTATLLRDGRVVFRAPVGIGRPEAPTPKGQFYIRDRLTRYSSPFYGPLAFGTSARSATLTDWPAGGFIGIHGTNEPELLPGRVSHGCIRLRNADIVRLGRLMPVGTPVTIV